MEIKFLGDFIISDNSLNLISIVSSIINYSDPSSELNIIYTDADNIKMHITPSSTDFRECTINNLLWCNTYLPVKIVFSKSLSISSKISFDIKFRKTKKFFNFSQN